MCFLALLYRAVPHYPVVIAANRDERPNRPGQPPRELHPGVWAPVDPQAGGTWLGVNAAGRVVALANRRSAAPPEPRARSRGLLCLELLETEWPNIEFPERLRRTVQRAPYNPFNLIVADRCMAWMASFTQGSLEHWALPPGAHLLGNRAPGSDEPKLVRARALIVPTAGVEGGLAMLARVCRDHGQRSDGADAICCHSGSLVTLSSILMALSEREGTVRYYYAAGPPCTAMYGDYGALFGLPRRR